MIIQLEETETELLNVNSLMVAINFKMHYNLYLLIFLYSTYTSHSGTLIDWS